MGKNEKVFRKLTAVGLSMGICLSGVISIHAEGDQTPQPTETATAEPTSSPSEQPSASMETVAPAARAPRMKAAARQQTTATASPVSTATPAAQKTATPAATPAGTAAPTATPAATPTPSATPAPKPTPTATPAPKPSAPADPNNAPSNGASEVQMFRVYNPNSGEHFYTHDASERNRLRSIGWKYEGVGWVAPSKGKPVYRLYNPNAGDHFYTMNAHEKDVLSSIGWRFEGTGWYSDTLQRTKIYRDYNPNKFSCNHNYTSNVYEHGALINIGWRNEDVAFYAMKPGWERTYSHGNVPYYSQIDPRWANQRYGGLSFGNTGCGVTGMAMIATSLVGRTVLPPEMAQYLYSVGEYNGRMAGTTGTARLRMASHYGLRVEKIRSASALRTALRLGMVVSEITENTFARGDSHGVVVFGYSNGNTSVYDPLYSSHNGTYSVDYMWNARARRAFNYDAGAVIFAFYKE